MLPRISSESGGKLFYTFRTSIIDEATGHLGGKLNVE